MKFEPIPGQPGLFRDPVTKEVFSINAFKPAHVIWTFREGPTHPSVRVAASWPGSGPLVLSAISTPLVGNGEGYFRLKHAAAPLVGVQQFRLPNAVLVYDTKELSEAELYHVDSANKEEVIVVGFGLMRLSS